MSFRSLATLLILAAPAAAADLQTLAGKKVSGDLVGLDARAVVLRTPAGDVRIPAADVLILDLTVPEPPAVESHWDVELTDGSVLHAKELAIRGNQVALTMLPNVAVTAPLAAVANAYRDAQDPKVRQQWQQFLARRGRLDVLVPRPKDGGKFEGLDGALGDGTAAGDAIEFTPDAGGQKIAPKLARLQGLVFVRRGDGAAAPTLCKVTDVARNLLVAADVASDGPKVTVTTVSGAKVEYAAAARLARVDFSKGKLSYLSDLDPTTVDESSTEDHVYHYARDKDLDGGQIRVAGVLYPKGLTLHSRTVLVYDVGGDYRAFRAVLGVDESVRTDSRVRVTVEGDGRELFKAEVGRQDPPRPLTLDVQGVRLLRVTVASAFLDLGNQVTLADAKVSK